MTQNDALNILSKIAQGKATQKELNDLAREIANGGFNFNTVGGKDISNGGFSFDMNALENYKDGLSKINAVLNKTLKSHKNGQKYTEAEQKIINDCIIQYEELLRQREKRNEFDYLNIKQIREGLTLEERRTKNITNFLEQKNINSDKLFKGINEIKSGFSELKTGINSIGNTIKGIIEPWSKVDQAASQYTRTIGGSAASMKELRKNTLDFMNTRSIGAKYNTSMEELIKLQSSYNTSIGRSISLTNDQKETFAAMKAVAGEQTAIEFTTKLENFGLSTDEAGKRMGEMFGKASKSGVAFEKYSKNFLDNIKLAQNYNFTNGLKGLAAMAQKATEVKLNMQQVASFAEKVSTLEGAMTAGANLSVLGGSFANFGNPLQMLYEGLNDMEGLQNRVINMFGDLGKWDYAKGQVDVSVFNKQRIKAASQAMGMDYGEVMQMVNANARRNIVEGQLGRLGSDVLKDKEMKDLILNKAQLDENGRAYVTIDGNRRDLSKITASDKRALQRENASDSDNIREIATNTRGFKDLMEGFDKQKESIIAGGIESTGIGDKFKSAIASVSQNTTVMKILAWMPKFAALIGGIASIEKGVGMMGNGMGNIFTAKGSTSAIGNATKIPTMRTLKNGTQQVWVDGGVSKGGHWVDANSKAGKAAMKNLGNVGKIGNSAGKIGSRALGSVGGGLLAGGITAFDEFYTNADTHSNGEKIGATAGATIGAIAGGALGSFIGMPVAGAMLGAWGGEYFGRSIGSLSSGGSWNGEKARQEKLEHLSRRGVNLNGSYTEQELDTILLGRTSVRGNRELEAKLMRFGDILPEKYYKGGYTGNGGVLEPAGIVHKGEYVMNSSDVDSIKNGNVLRPIGNMLNQLQVSKNSINTSNVGSVGPESIDININIGGKIDVEANGSAKSISGNDILTNEFIDGIIRKIQERTNYALNKDKTHIKFMG